MTGRRALDTRQRRVLAAMLACNALVFLDQTAVVVALPSIADDLGGTPQDVRWTITAYLLPLAVFMVLAGRIADHVGRRRTLLAGMALFALGSAACALAPSMGALIAFRALQGIGGALLQPLVLSNTTRVMPDERRGWAIGLLATGGTTFLILGPLIAAGILEAGSWRWIFVINLPVLAVAFAVARRWVTPSRESRPRPLEPVGVALLLTGLAATVVGVTQIAEWGAPSAGLIAAGLLVLAAFVRREMRLPQPLIRVDLLRDRLLATSLVALFAIQFVVLGSSVHLVLFAERGLEVGTVEAGLLVAVAGVFTPLLSIPAGRIADRRGPRSLVIGGLALASAGLVWMALSAGRLSALLLLPGLLVFSLGRPAVFTPAGVGPFATLTSERRAFAAGLVTESRQLGAVMGVAVIGAVFAAAGEAGAGTDPEVVAHGFRAGMLTAAGVTAAALVTAAAWMPGRAARPSAGLVREGAHGG
ncbi:MAG: MFS transporter [Thermoleophilia bacterium]